jgi:sugar phosphate permease
MVVSALCMPVVGRIVDRHSMRWTLAAGAVATAVGVGLMGRVSSLWQIFLLYGLAYAVGNAAASTTPVGVMISRWFERSRGVANSAALAGAATGQLVIIALLASFLTSLGWRTSYGVLGAANLVIVLPVVLALVRSRPPTSAGASDKGQLSGASGDPGQPSRTARRRLAAASSEPLSVMIRSRSLWLLFITYAVCGFQDFFVSTHVVAFADDQGVGPVLSGNLLAMMGVMGLLGVMLSGVLADTYGAKWPTGLSFVFRIAVFASVLYFQSTPGILVFGLLYGFTFLVTAPLSVVFAGNIFGTERLGMMSGLLIMVHQTSGGLGAFVGAVIYDRSGSYDGAFALMLGLAVVAITTTVLVSERPLAQTPRPA